MTNTLEAMRRHSSVALSIARGIKRRLPKQVPLEDLEQAALIALWDWKRNHPDEDAPGWMGGLRMRVRGGVIDEIRKQDWLPRQTGEHRMATIVALDEGTEARLAACGRDPEQRAVDRQMVEAAFAAPLAERDSEVINLIYFEGVAQRDVAVMMGCHEARVSQLQKRALSSMRAQLSGDQRALAKARKSVLFAMRRRPKMPATARRKDL